MKNIIEKVQVCSCNKTFTKILNENKAELKCYSCKNTESIKDSEIYSEVIKKVANTSITYSSIINNIAYDNTCNKEKRTCKYCSYPIMNVAILGDDMKVFRACPSCKQIEKNE